MAKIKIANFVKQLADKVGGSIDQGSQAFIDLLSSQLEIDDSISNAIMEGTITIDTASKHPDVRKKLRAETLNGMDASINKQLEVAGLSDEVKAEINAEKDTFRRVALFTERMKEHSEAQIGLAKKLGTKPSDAEEALKAQVAKLTSDFKALSDMSAAEKQSLIDSHSSQLTDWQLNNMLASKKYALPSDMPASTKSTLAMNILKSKLAAEGLSIRNENGSLTIVTKEGIAALDKTNAPIMIDKYVDNTLIENKLIDLSGNAVAAPAAQRVIAPDAQSTYRSNGRMSYEDALNADIKSQTMHD
jgi:hypothetical protein